MLWGILDALEVSKFALLVSLDDFLVSLARIVHINSLRLGAFDEFILCWNFLGIESLADSEQTVITPYQNYP